MIAIEKAFLIARVTIHGYCLPKPRRHKRKHARLQDSSACRMSEMTKEKTEIARERLKPITSLILSSNGQTPTSYLFSIHNKVHVQQQSEPQQLMIIDNKY